ncbi:hypothetical protein E4U21_006735 [Claviceps maximensis]|nr:hypothetical protein E4U21_006735 [Claviceps maximensis]
MRFITSPGSVPSNSDSDTDMAEMSLDRSAKMSHHDEAPALNSEQSQTVEILTDAAIQAASSTIIDGHEADETAVSTAPISTRTYQLEMLKQSLNQNAIVVMDTGSGKTHVAVLRIKAELEKSGHDKIIWFLAPTVALCSQQFDVIRLQIAAVPMKLLTGQEKVETWSAAIWKTILLDVRIVVSTYQVLLDALCHSFIKMDRISLIVFDEAHNCSGKHPGSKIMTDFYHRRKEMKLPVPAILGITATPSMTEDIQNINVLEATLDGKCITPTLHRDELFKCVKRPQIRMILYSPHGGVLYTSLMRRLHDEFQSLDITEDPYILRLQKDPTERNRRALVRAIEKYDTFVQNQIRGLRNRSVEIAQQLGSWAADFYVWKSAVSFLERVNDDKGKIFDNWVDNEKQYVASFLHRLALPQPHHMPRNGDEISDKVGALIRELLFIDDSIVCIIFATERATVSILCDLLCSCPRIAQKYRIGSMVGSSNYQSKRNALYEPPSDPSQTALQEFRSGKLDILIATSVLEEGIDVPACNMVICFDHPSTPKAFVQRRGRARMEDSTLLLLSEHQSPTIKRWEALEEEMKAVYQDTQREIMQLRQVEDSETTCPRFFQVKSTGARLDFDNAKSHLEHFCRVLSVGEFVDSRPDYIIHRHEESTPPTLSATVLLPSFVPTRLRVVDGKFRWISEKNATKEVAFQAYRALYDAGMVNEHLLPFKYDDIPGVEERASEVEVEALFDPWIAVANTWKQVDQVWLHSLTFYDTENSGERKFDVVLPVKLDGWQPIQIYLSLRDRCRIECESRRLISAAEAASLPDHTSYLLALYYAHRWTVEERSHVIKICVGNKNMSLQDIGGRPFDASDETITGGDYLIRDASYIPCQYLGLISNKPPLEQIQSVMYDYHLAPEEVPYLIVKKWTRRTDFLHPVTNTTPIPAATTKLYPQVLPLPMAKVDTVPLSYARIGMLIPSVMHEIEVMLIAKELSETLLRDVRLTRLDLVRQAISSGSASEPVDYERLEFLGDSVLKYLAAVQVSAIQPDWPEGYLSFFKDRIVSNSRLSRAVIDTGLAKFILTKTFTGHKWRPMYLTNYDDEALIDKTRPLRKMSTKTLADVAEALIGASYADGGLAKAQACTSVFINEIRWHDVTVNRGVFYERARDHIGSSSLELEQLEELVGYRFTKRSLLLEAMTHPSCLFNQDTRSYEHLEFLGDAILDYIIVRKLYACTPPLQPSQMHTLKTAMVNGDFLAFLCLHHSKARKTEKIVTPDLEVVEQEEAMPLALWNFMRHSSEPIGVEQVALQKRFEALRTDVLTEMADGDYYPWALLARLQAKKFYSDVFESLVGAIWVDSGSVEECEALLVRLGVLSYMDRLIRDGVQVQHPKELLGKYAAAQTVTYRVDAEKAENGGGEARFSCSVLVGSNVVAQVFDGVSREEVKIKAAYEAVRIMNRAEKEEAKEAKMQTL